MNQRFQLTLFIINKGDISYKTIRHPKHHEREKDTFELHITFYAKIHLKTKFLINFWIAGTITSSLAR